MKRIFVLAVAIMLACLAAFGLVSCAAGTKYDASATGEGTQINMAEVAKLVDSKSVDDFTAYNGESDYVLIKVKDYGEIVVVLRGDVAPKTVENFKRLVAEGFYDGTVFHRVMENFMIQGGGFESVSGTLVQKRADNIDGEFTFNRHTNNLRHYRGVISMARAQSYNSASSQFFIVHETNTKTLSLDGSYATFGYVIAGMDVVDAIATCEVAGDANSPKPVYDVVIESVTFVKLK